MEHGLVYICDASDGVRQHLRELLEGKGHLACDFASGKELLRSLEEDRGEFPDLILLDARLPGSDSLEVLRRLRGWRPETKVVMMSALATVRGAVEALKLGAYDYLIKPFVPQELFVLVEKVVELGHLATENRSLKAEIQRRFDPGQVVYKSVSFGRVVTLAKKVASSGASVLILGESGTGKELIASTIHYGSRRRDKRFLTINCAALTETLLESQLFGHAKGAFTGAVSKHRGLVEEASGGSLFLDEVGELSPALQAKLLRLLQEREFMPVGATRVLHADVRFIAATNRNLEEDVRQGRFREDLFYRLNVVTLEVPPLRERPEDVIPLAEFFLGKYAPGSPQSLCEETARCLVSYGWPGNVRELGNVIEMGSILASGEPISLEHLPVKVSGSAVKSFELPADLLPLDQIERLYIEQVYRQTGGHKVRTAEILQVSRKTLYRKLQQYGLD